MLLDIRNSKAILDEYISRGNKQPLPFPKRPDDEPPLRPADGFASPVQRCARTCGAQRRALRTAMTATAADGHTSGTRRGR